MKKLVLLVLLFICYVPIIVAQSNNTDSVTVTFKVVIPKSTPDNATIFWAGSLNHWDPGDKGLGFGAKDYSKPLTAKNGVLIIKLIALRNTEVSYKYTRGSIFSAEEKVDYTYRPVRTVTFDKPKIMYDTVKAWHDIPPKALQSKWPKIDLVKAELTLYYNDYRRKGTGTIIYDKTLVSRYYDIHNKQVKHIPEQLSNSVSYYVPISKAPDNSVLVVAGQLNDGGKWNVYVDQNNDNGIEPDELIFTIIPDSVSEQWTGRVSYQKLIDDIVISDSIELTINEILKLPKGYRSSVYKSAPDLGYMLPYKGRKATIGENNFDLATGFDHYFTEYFRIVVDRNHNDSLEIGSGSNEVTGFLFNQMAQLQKYYLYPTFKLGGRVWEVANIDPYGDWIRLRPSHKTVSRQAIAEGKLAPNWKAVTVKGDTLRSKSLLGNYVLLDFWGSWCGPCRAEIPLLKKVYNRFKTKNFNMIGFAYDSQQALAKALKRYQLPWPQVLDDEHHYATKFLVRGYPSHFLIGPKGNVLEMGGSLRGEQLISTLEKYLGSD